MFNHKKAVPQEEPTPTLKTPKEYHPVILARLGRKFVSSNIELPIAAYIELGEHFIRILREEPTEFSPNLKTTLYCVYTSKSSIYANNCGFTNEMTTKAVEDAIAEQILNLMTMSTETFGFQQMRLALAVAEEINPSKNIKNVNSFVFTRLKKESFIETARFIIAKLNMANEILMNETDSTNDINDNSKNEGNPDRDGPSQNPTRP